MFQNPITVKDAFKGQEKSMDFNVIVHKKFIDIL